MAYKEGQLLGFAKNGSPIYMAASVDTNDIDPGVIAGCAVAIGFLAVAAMAGIMMGESKKRKKSAPRMKLL